MSYMKILDVVKPMGQHAVPCETQTQSVNVVSAYRQMCIFPKIVDGIKDALCTPHIHENEEQTWCTQGDPDQVCIVELLPSPVDGHVQVNAR